MEQGQSETGDPLRVVREFLSELAHDLNNLLTEIVMLNELLLEELPANHPGRVDVVASRVAALRAAELTQRLLAFVSGFRNDREAGG